ncbi:MAG: tetratricopeptide repeat protein [Asgard group archaeon]|nr:tetratricopeptide repeat protein [Asgard group archaeon]
MTLSLPSFVTNEINQYIKGNEDSFYSFLERIIGDMKDEEQIRKKLSRYLNSIKKKMKKEDQFVLLIYYLYCYWSKEYEEIIDLQELFGKEVDTKNLSIMMCYLLALRDTFQFEEFQLVLPKIQKLINQKADSKEQDFLILSLNEFSSATEKKPELGFKALNELLRYLINLEDLAVRFPFILDALLCDLLNFAYNLADDTLKELWMESAIKRAENIENKGMLCSLYNLLAQIELKEYNVKTAQVHIDNGLKLAREISSSKLEAIISLNIATKEKMSGGLAEALNIYQRILKIDNLIIPLRIQTLSKIGDIHLLDDKIEKADMFYSEAHELNKDYGYIYPLVEITYGYVQILTNKDKGASLENGFNLAEEQFNFNAMSYYYFYKGLYNQKKVNYSIAVELFERALEFFENQLILEGIVYSYGALAESYFELFRITDENDYGTKFLYFIDNLLHITEELEHPLYIDAILTKASYFQYRNVNKKVDETLKTGLNFAERYNLADRSEEIQMRLRDKISLIEELRGPKRLFKKIMSFSFGSPKKIPIILYMLLVIDEGGLPLYSYKFSRKESIDDLLVSGLISAIINFSAEVLGKGTETLRSITHDGRAVIIEKQENVMVVLVADTETFESRLLVRKFLKESIPKLRDKLALEQVNEEEFHPLVESIFKASPFSLEG